MLFIFIYFMRADFKGCLRYHRRNTGRKIFLHSAITSSKAPEALLNKIQAEENHTRMWIKQKHTKVCQLNPHMHHMSTFALWEKKYLMHISVKRKKKIIKRIGDRVVWLQRVFIFSLCSSTVLSQQGHLRSMDTQHTTRTRAWASSGGISLFVSTGVGGVPISSFHV